jgi:hypothetical protein
VSSRVCCDFKVHAVCAPAHPRLHIRKYLAHLGPAERAAAERANSNDLELYAWARAEFGQGGRGRHCYSTLSLTVISWHSLGLYTVILLLLLSFYVEMTVSPWARPGGARDARQLRPLPPRKRATRAGAAPSLPPRPGRTLVKGLEKWKPTHRAVGHPYETAPQGMPEGVSGERRCRSCWAQPAAVRGGDGAVACRGPIVSSTSSSTS